LGCFFGLSAHDLARDEEFREPRLIDGPSLPASHVAFVSQPCLAKKERLDVLLSSRHPRYALDTLICFAASQVDFSAVSETEAKRKNAERSLDRNLGVWDIEITRHTLIESRTPNL
jgi:hypothetical protein